MAIALLIGVIALPILELVVLIKIGGLIGILPLLALLIGMAIAGGLVLRHQGLAVARRAMTQIARNEPPVQSMIDGIGLTMAGVLFLVPGLISDVAGLVLLIPAVRRLLIGRLIGATAVWWDVRSSRAPATSGPAPHEAGDAASPGVVIEGEFERLDERTVRPGKRPGSGPDRGPAPNGADPTDRSPWRR